MNFWWLLLIRSTGFGMKILFLLHTRHDYCSDPLPRLWSLWFSTLPGPFLDPITGLDSWSTWHSSGGASGQEPACQCRRCKRLRLDPWVGKIAWRKAGKPLEYSCLENPMDRGAWRAMVYRVTKSLTRLKWLSTHGRTRVCTTRTNHIFEERLLSSKFSGLYQKC